MVVLTCFTRPEDVLAGNNHIHFSGDYQNYVTLPVIPEK